MPMCPSNAQDGLVSGLVGTVDCYVRVLVQESYRELVGPDTWFATALTGLLTIYIALLGYQILFGRGGLRVTDLPVTAVTIGLILAFLTSWAAYQTVFFDLLFDGPRPILQALMAPLARMGAGFDGTVSGPCYVTQVRLPERDVYSAVQLGFIETKPMRLTGGQLGHLKRNNMPPLRFLREFRGKNPEVQEGQKLTVGEIFATGDHVDVVGTSKGKGFQSAVKRYHFKGGPKSHGASDRNRSPGSRGSGTTPGRVYKGARGPGHMGNERVTIHNLEVVLVDMERNLLGVRGAVPGARGGLLIIKDARKQYPEWERSENGSRRIEYGRGKGPHGRFAVCAL